MNHLDKNKVVVAMSGGVDSSVAALLLKQAGMNVIGIMMKLWDAPQGAAFKHASCCSVEDATDARRVAEVDLEPAAPAAADEPQEALGVASRVGIERRRTQPRVERGLGSHGACAATLRWASSRARFA